MGEKRTINGVQMEGLERETLYLDRLEGKFYAGNDLIESGSSRIKGGTYSFDRDTSTLFMDSVQWTTCAGEALDITRYPLEGGEASSITLCVRGKCTFASYSMTPVTIGILFEGEQLSIRILDDGVLCIRGGECSKRQSITITTMAEACGIRCVGHLDVEGGTLNIKEESADVVYGIYAKNDISLHHTNVVIDAQNWSKGKVISIGISDQEDSKPPQPGRKFLIDNSRLIISARTEAISGITYLKSQDGMGYCCWSSNDPVPDQKVKQRKPSLPDGKVKNTVWRKYLKLEPVVLEVAYCAHVRTNGWLPEVRNGQMAGTTGESRRLEAVKIHLNSNISDVGIKYRVHVKGNGWLPWVKNGEMAGTTGESRRAEAIQIELEGLEEYSVVYRVHMRKNGWSGWVHDGDEAGTTGESRRIEAVEIKIIRKSDSV